MLILKNLNCRYKLSQTKKGELILRNARIIDGTGEPSQYGDVAIQDDRLLAVGETGNIQSSRELHVGGKLVCPLIFTAMLNEF